MTFWRLLLIHIQNIKMYRKFLVFDFQREIKTSKFFTCRYNLYNIYFFITINLLINVIKNKTIKIVSKQTTSIIFNRLIIDQIKFYTMERIDLKFQQFPSALKNGE